MKRVFYFIGCLTAAASLALTTSCSNDSTSGIEEQQKGNVKISFNITNYMQYNMDEVTRASSSLSNLAHLALAVFDSEGKLVNENIQTNGEKEYGNFTTTLPYGTYTLVFLGYNKDNEVIFHSPPDISFSDNYVPNCFSAAMSLTVDANTTPTQNITLKRAVGAFQVVCTGGVPDEMTVMNYTAFGGGTSLNAITGHATEVKPRTGSIRRPSSASITSKDKFTFTIYSFLPADECTMQFDITAMTDEDTEIKSRSFADVPMKLNHMSIYTGNFFKNDVEGNTNGFTLSIEEGEWIKDDFTF